MRDLTNYSNDDNDLGMTNSQEGPIALLNNYLMGHAVVSQSNMSDGWM